MNGMQLSARVKAARTAGSIAAGLLALGALGGCSAGDATPAPPPPVSLTDIGQDGVQQVTLTEAAAQRLAVAMATASEPASGTAGVTVTIPYAAVVYASDGSAWTYVPAGARDSYVRQRITILSISGQMANLSAGPAVGTPVVTVGSAELLGAEAQISGEE
jgi:hypothetical protein